MKMTFTEEQQMLQNTVEKFFDKEAPIEKVREALESKSGHDAELWKKMSNAGWNAINIPEKYNGADGTLLDLAILVEQAGKSLIPTTFYSTLYTTLMLNEWATNEQKEKYLPKIAAGDIIGTVAFEEKNVLNDLTLFETTAQQTEGGWLLNGEKYFVPHAEKADYLLVVAKALTSYGIFLLEKDTAGLEFETQYTIDGRYFNKVKLNNVSVLAGELIGESLVTKEEIEKNRQKIVALQSIEAAGGSMKVVDLTIEFVKERKQFGVAIGTFQAVQHHLTNLYTKAQGARLIAYKAISLLETNGTALREVSIANVYASNAYVDITIMAHQLWAGMGYSTESNLFLWSNRAKTIQLTLGTPSYHKKNLGKIIRSKVQVEKINSIKV